jgi:cytochrome oxidase Cu insertion factor (SCO1/SenC/PrrC family)
MSNDPAAKNRWSLWLIVALCVAPVIASYVAYYVTPPAGHTNYGDLLNAPPLPPAQLRLVDGAPFEMSALRGKWVLLMADSAQCNEACQRKLLVLRQLRLTQGKEMERIERAWLISDEGAVPPGLAGEFSGTWLIRAGAGGILKGLPAERPLTDYIYVLDPLGNIVLRYGRDAEPGRMIKDLTRLLKTSRIG